MTRKSAPFLSIAIPAALLITSLACNLSSLAKPVVPTVQSGAVPTDPIPSVVPSNIPVASAVPSEATRPDAAACDRMSFIDVSAGSTQTLPFSDTCATDCKQTITFKNNSPSEVIKLVFFEDLRCRPDQGCLNGQRWYSDNVLTPGDTIEIVQFNRTPHSGECPWVANDASLVGAIPTGSDCAWVLEDPGTSQLPLLQLENQCR